MNAVEPTHMPAVRRGLRWWGWALIAFGVIVSLALPALGLFAYVQHGLRETSPDQPFLVGPVQRPDAQTPLPCSDPCFDLVAADALAVSDDDVSLLEISDELYPVGSFDPGTVVAVASGIGDAWLESGGDEECAFLPANAPYVVAGPGSESRDPISWIQTWMTGDEVMDISARIFPNTDDAIAFMHDLHARVAVCPWQDLSVPAAGGLDTSLVQITPQAAVAVPDEVAAVGWVREGEAGPRWRAYVWDLQRGNLVVQVRVLTDGRIL